MTQEVILTQLQKHSVNTIEKVQTIEQVYMTLRNIKLVEVETIESYFERFVKLANCLRITARCFCDYLLQNMSTTVFTVTDGSRERHFSHIEGSHNVV